MTISGNTTNANQGQGGIAPKEEEFSQRISWEEFEKEYLVREDEYTYEWLDGHVHKTKRTMNKYQLYILKNLQDFFRHLINEKKAEGNLVAEADLFFLKKHRRPDLCWIAEEQFKSLAQGVDEIPAFIIEIISKSELGEDMTNKMDDYRAGGVQVVWHIFPNSMQVHVYKGEDLKEMTVHMGEEICSAEPALPAFKISPKNILKL